MCDSETLFVLQCLLIQMQWVSVSDGGRSVSLNSRLTEHRHVMWTWTFGYSETRIAIINREDGIVSTLMVLMGDSETDWSWHQTGSLTITNTRTTDSGLYSKHHRERTAQIQIQCHCLWWVRITCLFPLSAMY